MTMTTFPAPWRVRSRSIPGSTSIRRGARAASALALLLLPAVAPAAAQAPLSPGTRIRVQVPDGPVSERQRWAAGQLVSWDAQAIVLALESGEELRVESEVVRRVQLSQGTRRAVWKGARIGGLVLGTSLGVAAFATELGCTERPGDWFGCFNPLAVGAMAFGLGAVAGGAAGALVGAFIPVERWQDAPPFIQVEGAPAHGGGMYLGVRLSTGHR